MDAQFWTALVTLILALAGLAGALAAYLKAQTAHTAATNASQDLRVHEQTIDHPGTGSR